MFRFTQEPSSGSHNYDSIVLVVNDVIINDVNDVVINDEHNRIIIVVLAKHEIAPWLWFLHEPKRVGAIFGILIIFNIHVIL